MAKKSLNDADSLDDCQPPSTISSFDKDGWQSSKLSASLRIFLAMFSQHLTRYE